MPITEEITSTNRTRPKLRFGIDALRDMGASLGPIQSSVARPKATFEGLIERANRLQKRARGKSVV